MKKALEWHMLLLVTLALIAFGLVMVYSATSAPAALGSGDPTATSRGRRVYALIGLTLLVARRADGLPTVATLAPPLLLGSLVLLRGGARRRRADERRAPLDHLRAGGLPAVGAREARARDLGRRPPRAPSRAADARRSSASRSGLSALLRAHPARAGPRDRDHDRRHVRRAAARRRARRCAARRAATPIAARSGSSRSGSSRTAARACSASSTRGSDAQGAGFQSVQALIGLGSGGLFGMGSARESRRSSTSPRRTPT